MKNDHPLDALIAEYAAWMEKNPEIESMSADEVLVCQKDLTEAQRQWLEDFISRWDAAVR